MLIGLPLSTRVEKMDKIPVSGVISPISLNDSYPVIDPRFGIDGMRSLNDTTEMYNLPLEKRRAGMVVAIPNTPSNNAYYYSLKPEGNGVTWEVGSSSNWYSFLTSVTGSNAVPIKYSIIDETITVPQGYEYLLWGTMSIGQSGSFVNDGHTYIINGTIATSGNGTYSNTGEINFITVPTKYSTTGDIGPNGTLVVHNLNTQDIVYSFRQGTNFITANVEIVSSNSIFVSTFVTHSSVTVTVIG